MENNLSLSKCDDNDVLDFGGDTFRVKKLKQALDKSLDADIGDRINNNLVDNGVNIDETILRPNDEYEEYTRWFSEGVDCEILQLGANRWKKGKVKIKVSFEFYTEEPEDGNKDTSDNPKVDPPESPLDDLRQRINQDNQPENQ
ncbi:KGK domain-containing protein [Coleofasciculus sp. F4-SAH-05]|uniref:KGK domain-containing protein n=1 Tax=Coleofasciculus sp. F4-SAH-05 TaxID=3069525 RepID=UPI0032F4A35B